MSDSVRPHRWQPVPVPGSPIPGILQARILEWVAISFSNAWKWKVKVKSLSCVWLLATPWTAAYQAPPSMGLSRQEYWSGVPLALHICCLNHFLHVPLTSGPLCSLSSPRKVSAMLEPTPPILHLPSPTVTPTHSPGAGYTWDKPSNHWLALLLIYDP